MSLALLRTPASMGIAAIVAIAAGGTGWALLRGGTPAGAAVPKDLSVDSLKAQAKEDPGKMMDTIRDTMRRDDLTEEQRRQVGENMRKVWDDAMTERVDEYYAAKTDDERNEILDRQIDEFEARRKEWQARRAEEEKKNGKDGADRGPGPGGFGPQTREERKERAESRDPDKMARQMAYFSAMRQRMSDRGIKAPSFGPGGRGGPGAGSGSRPRGGP